jgi:hypothetical protein
MPCRACIFGGQGGSFPSVTRSFERFAAFAAFFVAAGGLLYSLLFIFIVEGESGFVNKLWFFTLMIGGLASIPVLVAVYGRLRVTDPGFALVALLLGLSGALGGILHGAYELAALVTPPDPGYYPGPEAVSKGVLRYGIAGLALILIAWLIHRGGAFPRILAYLGYLGGAILVFIYIGRLYDFINPGDYVSLVPPIAYGFVIHPLWYLLLGRELLRTAAVGGPRPDWEEDARASPHGIATTRRPSGG